MRQSNRTLIVWATSFAVAGMLDVVISSTGQADHGVYGMLGIFNPIFAYSWCNAHARERCAIMPTGSGLLLAVLTPIAIPFYFFSTMRWTSALIWTAKAIVVGMMFLICAVVSGWLTQQYVGP